MKETPSRPHITFPRRRVVTPETRRMCEPHWADLGPDDVTDSVTSRERTLADCLRTLPRDQALCIADSALRGGFAPSSLVALAAGLRGAGAGRARSVAAAADGRAANPFESCLRAIASEVPGLTPEPQVPSPSAAHTSGLTWSISTSGSSSKPTPRSGTTATGVSCYVTAAATRPWWLLAGWWSGSRGRT